MKSVIVQLEGSRLRDQLCAIRDWFGRLGFEPLRYDYACDDRDDLVRIRLDFTTSEEAQIFCAQFEGQLTV